MGWKIDAVAATINLPTNFPTTHPALSTQSKIPQPALAHRWERIADPLHAEVNADDVGLRRNCWLERGALDIHLENQSSLIGNPAKGQRLAA